MLLKQGSLQKIVKIRNVMIVARIIAMKPIVQETFPGFLKMFSMKVISGNLVQ